MEFIKYSKNKKYQIERKNIIYFNNIPKDIEESPKKLARFLVKDYSTDKEKAFAIYSYIVTNISYDTNFLKNNTKPILEPEKILKYKNTICSGYSYLFEKMAKYAGLRVKVESGIVKNINHKKIDWADSSHAWNSIVLDNREYYIDCTHGAGYVNDYVFIRNPKSIKFCMTEEIKNMFYLDENKINKNIEVKKFLEQPLLKDYFFLFDVYFYKSTKLVLTESLNKLYFYKPENVLMLGEIKDSKQDKVEGAIFLQNRKNAAEIRYNICKKGTYYLDLYAKFTKDKTYVNILTHKLIIEEVKNEYLFFPLMYDEYKKKGAILFEPTEGELIYNKYYDFSIMINNCLECSVIIGDKWNKLDFDKKSNIYSGRIKITDNKVMIYGKFKEGNSFDGLIKYRVIK